MKNIAQYILIICCFFLASCDKGFDALNVNPIALTNIDPALQLNSAIVNSAPTYGNLSYETTIVKQMITPFSGTGSAANFNQDNRSVSNLNWNQFYQLVIKDLVDATAQTKDVTAKSNLYNMIRIWKAYAFMILTDTYGDIPYTQAGQNYLTGISTPVYDTQESVMSGQQVAQRKLKPKQTVPPQFKSVRHKVMTTQRLHLWQKQKDWQVCGIIANLTAPVSEDFLRQVLWSHTPKHNF